MFLTGKASNRWRICRGTALPPLPSSHTEGWEEVTAVGKLVRSEWDRGHVLRLPAHLCTQPLPSSNGMALATSPHEYHLGLAESGSH